MHPPGVVAGLEGVAVIADAVISVAISIVTISVFGLAGVITAEVLAFALLEAISIPGAFLARAYAGPRPLFR